MNQTTVVDGCNCTCHPNHRINTFKRPSMTQLHQLVQNREWNKIKQVIRNDVSVAMRIDDSADENEWFHSAREAAWCRDTGLSSKPGKYSAATENNNCCSLTEEHKQDTSQSIEGESLPVRYWLRNQNGQSAIRQRRTLLHSISKLKFHSNEALVAQLSAGDCEELHDLVEACLTAKMLIDASVNELKPVEEGCYNEDISQDSIETCLERICQKCSCYYHVMFCPPVGLDPVENYSTRALNEADTQLSDESQEKVLHQSVLSMTDGLGATPLHILTGEGSAHIDLARIFVDGCNASGDTRRPSVYELLSAQNGHGCTPLHFLSDNTSEEVMRFLLNRLQQESAYSNSCNKNATNNQSHPLLIQDNEGDTPLHFACSNGANAPLLSLLTSDPSQYQSVAVRNSYGRLPIDDLITWYVDLRARNLEDFDSDDESESSDYDNVDDSTDSESNTIEEDDLVQDCGPDQLIPHAMKLVLLPQVGPSQLQLTLNEHCKYYLWDRMLVLILTSARLLTLCSLESNISAEIALNPIHAATIATKYFNFPAIALVASVLMMRDELAEAHGHDLDLNCYTKMALSQEDNVGLLPLHLACGKFAQSVSNTTYQRSIPAGTSPLSIRWNTKGLHCSVIEFLLYLCPDSAQVPTREGQYPLHMLLDVGNYAQYESTNEPLWGDVKRLLAAWPEAIRTPDIHTQMYPFQTAAASISAKTKEEGEKEEIISEANILKSTEITYRLILEDPSLCCKAIA